MRVLIIEDEKPARAQLERAVLAWDASATVAASLGGVKESVAWLRAHEPPDLILSDIQLSDGLSLSIFEQVRTPAPVVFCTAYDEYLQDALRLSGIDYILKPLQTERLHAALDKYLRLRAHFVGRLGELTEQLRRPAPTYRERLLVKRGIDYVSLATEEIAYFVSEHKVAVAVDRTGRQYVLDGSLSDIERELDPRLFFRANRKYLVHIRSVVSFRSYFKGRLLLALEPPVEEDVVVSQENGAAFRAWMGR